VSKGLGSVVCLGTRQRAGVESEKSSSSMLEMVHLGTGDVGGYGKLYSGGIQQTAAESFGW
jgi:hypothetical protein